MLVGKIRKWLPHPVGGVISPGDSQRFGESQLQCAEARPLRDRMPQLRARRENRRQLVQIAIAGFCAANAMWIAVAFSLGTLQYLSARGIVVSESDRRRVSTIAARGASPIALAIDGQLYAVLAIADGLRAESHDVVRRLKKEGWQVGILSGDHQAAVDAIAAEIGIEPSRALGGLTPEQKLEHIRRSRKRGATVVMVGDGVNDAAALAAADVGIAVRGGAEASLAAAPVYLADGRLSGLNVLIAAAGKTTAVIRRNFFASLAYNGIAVGLATAGLINPLIAAILMPISSLTVLSITLASRTFPAIAAQPVAEARS